MSDLKAPQTTHADRTGDPGTRPTRKPVPISRDRGATISSLVSARREFRPPGPTCQSCIHLGEVMAVRFPDGTKRLKRRCREATRLGFYESKCWTEPDAGSLCPMHTEIRPDV